MPCYILYINNTLSKVNVGNIQRGEAFRRRMVKVQRCPGRVPMVHMYIKNRWLLHK